MYIRVMVQPRAKLDNLRELAADRFEIKVRAKAERNLANDRVREILADRYHVPIEKVKIISGHRHPHKIISIDKPVLTQAPTPNGQPGVKIKPCK